MNDLLHEQLQLHYMETVDHKHERITLLEIRSEELFSLVQTLETMTKTLATTVAEQLKKVDAIEEKSTHADRCAMLAGQAAIQLETGLNDLSKRVDVLELEEDEDTSRPVWWRSNGETIAIADMHDSHLRNAVLKCLRGEVDLTDSNNDATTLKDLLSEAADRDLPWQAWTHTTPPTTKQTV